MAGLAWTPVEPLRQTARFVRRVVPRVDAALARWRRRAAEIPDAALRRQALASIDSKWFHCVGGAVFAVALDDEAEAYIGLIVALQTISDYLDNLGDRTDSLCEEDFRQLHEAMLDAVRLEPSDGDYYRRHPHKDDGGYLRDLVAACRAGVAALPRFDADLRQRVLRLLSLYADLQVYKHLPADVREERLIDWYHRENGGAWGIEWWEFSAACGSTLAVFALFLCGALGAGPSEREALMRAYFPWICGVHILLDYLIDQDEDEREGDLNFVSYYPGAEAAAEGICRMVRTGKALAGGGLPQQALHAAVLEGLPAMYLSDPKVTRPKKGGRPLQPAAERILRSAGWRSRLVHRYCLRWRSRYRGAGGQPIAR